MARMKAAQISKPGGEIEIVERDVPQPGPGQVRIRVEACGICHSDVLVKQGSWPGLQYPRIPGHEIAGVIDVVGTGVTAWKPGQRVGVGWAGGFDFQCESCRRGDFILCDNLRITGFSFDGGYAQYAVIPQEGLAAIPDDLPAAEAAPLVCAGITVYNSLRNAGARAGDVVAVQGIGGLGHLGIQFAKQMGFYTVAIGQSRDKEALAMKLGAKQYVDASREQWQQEILKLGGAKVALATAPSAKGVSEMIGTLAKSGKLLIIGAAPEPIQVNGVQLLVQRQSIQGWPSGPAKDSEDTLKFSKLSGVRPMIESYPLEKAAEAFERMISGKARFRVVLTMNS